MKRLRYENGRLDEIDARLLKALAADARCSVAELARTVGLSSPSVSERRFGYSAIGDGVNLASRLEGQSKTYGVPIVVGEATVRAAAELAFLEIDLLSVVGKIEAVHAYALLGDEGHRQSASFRELSQRHGEMLSAYRSRRFEEARALLEPARAAGGAQLSALYDLYAERIAGFLVTPPPADWDGRAIAESK